MKEWSEEAKTPVGARAGAAQMTSLPHKLVLLGGPESGLTSPSHPGRSWARPMQPRGARPVPGRPQLPSMHGPSWALTPALHLDIWPPASYRSASWPPHPPRSASSLAHPTQRRALETARQRGAEGTVS